MKNDINKTQKFISRAKVVHQNKYDYSQSTYLTAKIKVKIICPKHGIFLQSPDNHLKGKGCPKCSGKNWTKEDFLIEAKKTHGDKYIYKSVVYKNKKTPVKIVCKKHGVFFQNPYVHLKGSGCPKCVGKNYTFQELVEMAKEKHGNKYIYKSIETKKSNNKSRTFFHIYCPIHNHSWHVTTDAHIYKNSGCKYCGNEESSIKQRSNFSDIKERIEKIFPTYTVIENNNYKNQHSKITYKCNIHGLQRGIVNNLLNGEGCPVCGQESRNSFFRDSWQNVIDKIEKKHPHYHVYRDQSFENHHSPIVFCCDKHGDKISTANSLLSKGAGCDECGHIKRSISQKSNWEDVAKKIETIHENISVPRSQDYINTKNHIVYECSIHGLQKAAPSHLLQGRGCPKCAIENRNNYSDSAWCKLCGDRVAKLYWLKMRYGNYEWYKIGKTFQKIEDRWWELKKKNIEYEVIQTICEKPEIICDLERSAHKKLKGWHYIPSIPFGGHLTECFEINNSCTDKIRKYLNSN